MVATCGNMVATHGNMMQKAEVADQWWSNGKSAVTTI